MLRESITYTFPVGKEDAAAGHSEWEQKVWMKCLERGIYGLSEDIDELANRWH
jgi:hypothetical protein